VARDGVLPLSSWIGQVDEHKQPRNAVTVMYIFGAILLCTILPSQVAFTSLISAGGIPTTAAYGLIALLRLFMTPNDFKSSKFKLGPFAKYFYVAAAFFNAIVFSVQVSPFFFPVTAETFNFVSGFRTGLLLPYELSSLTYSAISLVGWSYFGCSHHLRDIELVVHPRRKLASQETGG
jgi:amino acid permease